MVAPACGPGRVVAATYYVTGFQAFQINTMTVERSAVPSRRPPEPDLHLGPPVVSPPLRRQVGGDGVGGAARQHA